MEGSHIKYASRLIRSFARTKNISMKTGRFKAIGNRIIVWDTRISAEIPDITWYAEYMRMYPPK